MRNLTNLELLMEYMEQNQYFIGNDLLAKYNELLQKEKKEQLAIQRVSQQRELLIGLLTKLENGGGSAFIDKEQIVDDYLKAN